MRGCLSNWLIVGIVPCLYLEFLNRVSNTKRNAERSGPDPPSAQNQRHSEPARFSGLDLEYRFFPSASAFRGRKVPTACSLGSWRVLLTRRALVNPFDGIQESTCFAALFRPLKSILRRTIVLRRRISRPFGSSLPLLRNPRFHPSSCQATSHNRPSASNRPAKGLLYGVTTPGH